MATMDRDRDDPEARLASHDRPDEDEDEDVLIDEDEDDGYDDDDLIADDDGDDDDDDDDDAFDALEDTHFAPVIAEKDRKKPYEVDFAVISTQDMAAMQKREMAHVAGILGCSPQHAATLLRAFRWNKEQLIERYMESPEDVAASAGAILDSRKQPKPVRIPGFTCDICMMDDDGADGAGMETLALGCNHRYCVDCYIQYLTQKIVQEGESRQIQCPASKCTLVVDETTIEQLLDPPVVAKYKTLLLRTFVDDNNHKLRWCPAPNCEFAIECHVPPSGLSDVVPTVTCRCGHTFCFGCLLDDHQPCICSLVKLWLRKCKDDSETANWISANTKECSKCHSTIEKHGGCNHMTCRKCKFEFCWVCLGPWSEHGTQWYSCNRFDERNSVDARDSLAKSRSALQRYLHYYNRYANHEQSAKLDKQLHQKTEKKMEEMQNTSNLSWIEVQFLNKAVEVLLQSRMTLKWTYCFAYYLKRGNATDLFEDNQRDLEMAVEILSGLLENPVDPDKIAELKQAVLDKTVYVASRREVLLIDTSRGLLEGRWEYQYP